MEKRLDRHIPGCKRLRRKIKGASLLETGFSVGLVGVVVVGSVHGVGTVLETAFVATTANLASTGAPTPPVSGPVRPADPYAPTYSESEGNKPGWVVGTSGVDNLTLTPGVDDGLYAGDGNDAIYIDWDMGQAWENPYVAIGGKGDDTFTGETGFETDFEADFYYAPGDGDDHYEINSGNRVVMNFNHIRSSEVSFSVSANGNDIIISVDGGGSVTLGKAVASPGPGDFRWEHIRFETDGEINLSQMEARAIDDQKESGSVYMFGASDSITNYATDGSYTLQGATTGNDTLTFSATTYAQAIFSQTGNDLHVQTADGDTVSVTDYFLTGPTSDAMETITFSDATSPTQADISARIAGGG